MSAALPGWVRLGVAVTIGAPQLLIGLWAVVMPDHWYDLFPGFDPRLIAASPPYNEHLASDAGAGFLATGIALLAAALWDRRDAVLMALLAYVAFTVPHVAHHALRAEDSLTGAQNAMQLVMLSSGVVLAAVFAYGMGLRPPLARAAASSS
ncbi:MAG TPA: hypothetical protein VFU93_10780 [Acidimicrobiales bacterium]|nr:hypothetical protein [Acidimicrobiales bacterium]